MSDCLFCRIVNGDIPAMKVFENERVLAFNDISPKAPCHVLIIPKKHIATINDISEQDQAVIGEMVLVAKDLAADKGIEEEGYRLVINCNRDAGQEVFHIHLHLLGGRTFTWPPG